MWKAQRNKEKACRLLTCLIKAAAAINLCGAKSCVSSCMLYPNGLAEACCCATRWIRIAAPPVLLSCPWTQYFFYSNLLLPQKCPPFQLGHLYTICHFITHHYWNITADCFFQPDVPSLYGPVTTFLIVNIIYFIL